MPKSTASTTGLSSQYAAQVAGDLERNAQEQERVNTEIATLQKQLADLQHDRSVLSHLQQALGLSPETAQHPAPTSGSTAVPAPRTDGTGESPAGRRTRTRSEKAATSPGRTARKPAEKKAPGKAAPAKAPTLVALVRDHLTQQNEPRSAAEVTAALEAAHPERGIKTTVVRTTLEGLVAKNHANRSKQGSSVYYTAPDTTRQTPAPARTQGAAESKPDSEPADKDH